MLDFVAILKYFFFALLKSYRRNKIVKYIFFFEIHSGHHIGAKLLYIQFILKKKRNNKIHIKHKPKNMKLIEHYDIVFKANQYS